MDKIFTTKNKCNYSIKNNAENVIIENNELEVPSNYIIANILNYSKALKVQKSAYINTVEFIAN